MGDIVTYMEMARISVGWTPTGSYVNQPNPPRFSTRMLRRGKTGTSNIVTGDFFYVYVHVHVHLHYRNV